MRAPRTSRRPSLSTALGLVVAVGVFGGAVFGCAVGAEADVSPDVVTTDNAATEPEPGPTLPPPSQGEEPVVTDGDAGAGQDAGGGGGGGGSPGPAPKAAQGDLVISEIMYDCSGTEPLCEWLEVKNLRNNAVSLSGLTLQDSGGRTHVIGSGVVLAANAFGVLVRNTGGASTAKVPSASILYAYGDGLAPSAGVLLGNGSSGAITLRDGNTKIAEILYGGWFSTSGQSIQLKVLGSTQQSQKANWCMSASPWTSGSDPGTPGGATDC